MTTLLLALTFTPTQAPAPPALAALCERIEADASAPAWKQRVAQSIRCRTIKKRRLHTTFYCPASAADPQGGGPNAAWGSIRLRRGHCAVGTTTRAVPLGTVLYMPDAESHLLIVVDTGPGVNGEDRLDICVPDPEEYRARSTGFYDCWILGRVTQAEAR